MWPRRALFHSYSPSLVFHNTFQQPPEQCVRRPELARLSAVPTRGAVKDSHLDVFSNLDSGYRLRFPPLIWMLSLELHPLCLFKTKDQWISPVWHLRLTEWDSETENALSQGHACSPTPPLQSQSQTLRLKIVVLELRLKLSLKVFVGG